MAGAAQGQPVAAACGLQQCTGHVAVAYMDGGAGLRLRSSC